jgi:hypothetical protein
LAVYTFQQPGNPSKAILKAIGDEKNEFCCFSYATMVSHLGQYLDNGFPWIPGLSHATVTPKLPSIHCSQSSTPSPSPANTPPTTSNESGSKLVKIFASNPWDSMDETYSEWKDKTLDMLGLSPKALEQYQDPIAVAKDPELALITYTALLDAAEKRAMFMPLFVSCLKRRRLVTLLGLQWRRPWRAMIARNPF